MGKKYNNSSKAISYYLNQTKGYLSLPRKYEQATLKELHLELSRFELTNEGCTYEDFVQIFGEPFQIAQVMMENCDLEECKKHLKRKRVLLFIIGLLLVIIIIGLIYWLLSVLSHQEVSITEVIYESSAQNVLLEENF